MGKIVKSPLWILRGVFLLVVFAVVFSIFFSLCSSISYAENLNCTYLTDISQCNSFGGTKILGVYTNDNSQVELPNQSLYLQGVCCKDSGPSSKQVLNYTGYNFANISGVTNAHLGFNYYPSGSELFLGVNSGNVECQLFSDTSTCEFQNYSTCVIEIYKDTGNTHVTPCNESGPKKPHICCRIRYQDGDACLNDIDCANSCDNNEDANLNPPDDFTCFNPANCVNGTPILGGGVGKCEFDNGCGADAVCDEIPSGNVSLIDPSACCLNTCKASYSIGSINFSNCNYKNDTTKSKWCLSNNLSTCFYTGPTAVCNAATGWDSYTAYCPMPGTITNGSCYYNPTATRADDCNGLGCNVISMPINSGEFCDPRIGVTDILREINLDKSVVRFGSVIDFSYYAKVGLNVAIEAQNLSSGSVLMTFDGAKYVASLAVNDSGNGTRILYVNVTDMTGRNIVFNTSIYVDNTPPTGTVIINNNASFTNSRFVTVFLNASDDYAIANCSFSINNTFTVWTSCYNYYSMDLGISSGVGNVYVNITDLAGNSFVAFNNITVDETTMYSYIFDNSTFISGSHNFNFTNGWSNYYSLDGGPFISVPTPNVTIDTTQLSDGVHSLMIKNGWLFGRSSYSDLKVFITDNTPAYINLIQPIGLTTNNTIIFEISDVNLNISMTTVSFNDIISSFNPLSACISNGEGGFICTYSENLAQTTNQINITATDFAGNIKKSSFAINYSNDVTPPVITVISPSDKVNSNNVTLEVSTNEPATCKASLFTQTYRYMEYDLYQSSPLMFETNVVLDSYQNYTAYFACQDSSGNIGITSKDFLVDNTANIYPISPQMYSNMENVELKIMTDKNATCAFDYSDKSYQNLLYNFTKIQNNQTYYNHTANVDLLNGTLFYIRCIDISNNSNRESTIIKTILDETAPYVTLISNTTTNSNFISFDVYETDSGIKSISIKINDTDSSAFNINSNCADDEQGLNCTYFEPLMANTNNKITIVAQDNANNVNVIDFYVTLKNYAPTLIVNTPNATTSQRNLLLNITSDTPNGMCRWSISNKNFSNMEYTFVNNLYSVQLHEGSNSFYIKCQDYAGNENSSVLFVILKTNIGTLQITSPLPQAVLSGIEIINFTGAAAQDSPFISINGGTYISTTALNYQILNTSKYTNGGITIELKNTDTAGNVAYSDVVMYSIDNSFQPVYIIQPVDGSYVSGIIQIKTRVTDDTYSINYTIQNDSKVFYSQLSLLKNITYDTNQIPDGYYNISILARNIVGEITGTDTIRVYVANQLPIQIVSDNVMSGIEDISVVTNQNALKAVIELDNVSFGEDSSYPFNFEINTNLLESRNYTLSAAVFGYNGLLNTTSKQIEINNTEDITILTPVNSQIIQGVYNITFTGENMISPMISIDGTQFFVTYNKTFGSFILNTSKLVDGLHQIKIVDGQYSSPTITFTVKNQYATYIIEPKNSLNSKNVSIKIWAPEIARNVIILINGTVVYNGTNTPFEYNYNQNVSGDYEITAISYDSTGSQISNDTKDIHIIASTYFDCVIPPVISGQYIFNPNSSEYLDYSFEISLNGTDWYSIDWYFDTTTIVNGNYTIRITGTDAVNNKYVIVNTTTIENGVAGSVEVEKKYVKNGDVQKLVVAISSLSYFVFLVSPYYAYFNDNGTNGDEVAFDGKYTYSFIINDTQTHEVNYTVTIEKSKDEETNTTASFYVDNEPPQGSIVVNNGEQFVLLLSNYTNVSVVDAQTTFSDNIGVDSCRIYYKTATAFLPCTESNIVTFNDGYGKKTITYDIKDIVGNILEINTSVIIVPYDEQILIRDNTTPSIAAQIIGPTYTNNNQTITFNYTAGYDVADYLLESPLLYSIAIGSEPYPDPSYDNDLSFIQSGDVTSLFNTVNVSYPDGLPDGTYYASVRTKNHAGTFNVTSFMFYIVTTKPVVNITSNVNETWWSSNSTVIFNYFANDSAGITSYKYLLDRFNNSNPEIYTQSSNLTLQNVPDGIWYFHILAIDGANNIGPVSHYKFMIDSTPPTTPIVYTTQIGNDLYINWTQSHDYDSGVLDYEINITLSNGSQIYYNHTNYLQYIIYNITNMTYDISVRARNNALLLSSNSLNSFIIDTTPPKILVMTPTQTVTENVVYPYLETDKDSNCFIKNQNDSSYVPFMYTGKKEHTHELTLSNGPYTFDINCTDLYGNEEDTTMSFTVNGNQNVMRVSFVNISDTTYVSQIFEFTIKVEGTSGSLIDDINKDSVTVKIGGLEQDFSMQSIGDGMYKLSLITPNSDGTKTLQIYVNGLSTEKNIVISPLTLVSTFTSNSMNQTSVKSKIVYSTIENYSVGLATDAISYSSNISANSLSINYDATNGFGYIFMTGQNTNINSRIGLLTQNKFDSQASPSFGLPMTDYTDVAIKLRYSAIFNYSKQLIKTLENGTRILNNINPGDLILSSENENVIKNFRLSIRFSGFVNGTPVYNVDVLN